MRSILLIRNDDMPFDAESVRQIISPAHGFLDIRFDEPGGAVVEARYVDREDWSIVYLAHDLSRISLSGTSDASLLAALIVQEHLKPPLRIFDTAYSFDLILQDYSTLDELRTAIEAAQAN